MDSIRRILLQRYDHKGVAPSGAISGGNDPATDGSNQWMSGYAVGLALLKIITEVQKSAKKGRIIKEQFEAMATIPQDVRQKIADKTDTNNKTGSLFASEQAQLVWEKGYDLLKRPFPRLSPSQKTMKKPNKETRQHFAFHISGILMPLERGI